MEKTLIQNFSDSIINSFCEKLVILDELEHKLTKGELRELFVANILRLFLPSQLNIGTGIIINKNGKQSDQTDIIIYDNRLLPPFIKEQNIGVFPEESVVATIEVKTYLKGVDLKNAEKSAKKLYSEVYKIPESNNKTYEEMIPRFEEKVPICSVIGFKGGLPKSLSEQNNGEKYLKRNIKYLDNICFIKKYHWYHCSLNNELRWVLQLNLNDNNQEILGFIKLLVDNVRYRSHLRFMKLAEYKTWLSDYLGFNYYRYL